MPSSKMEVKHLNSPDEVRKFENGKIELVKNGRRHDRPSQVRARMEVV